MNIDLKEILRIAIDQKASDIFFLAGAPISFRLNGDIINYQEEKLMPFDTDTIITEIYQLAGERDIERLRKEGDDDFSFTITGLSRFRVSTYKQRGSLAAVIRIINFELPNSKELGIIDNVMKIADMKKGFVLVTGPAGSGKSTTLSCIIDRINETQHYHIITLEDPLEHLHRHKKCIVSQREVCTDTADYVSALRAALRQAPDVILLGEMRDYETIRTAVTAAETGHLVISTLHTLGAANTIDRIVDTFPTNQQQQIRVQLSMSLQAIVSQQLVSTIDGSLIPAFEVMFLNNAIRNMIRDSKVHQLDTVIASSAKEGMISMDTSLFELVQSKTITKENAIRHATVPEQMEKKLSMF